MGSTERDLGLFEASLRAPFGAEDLNEQLRESFVSLLRFYDAPFLVSYTVNVVLEGRDEEGEKTYKVHYGADYSPNEDRQAFNSLAPKNGPTFDLFDFREAWMFSPKEIQTVSEIAQHLPDPRSFSASDVEFLERLFDDSNVKIHSIVNLVIVFRKLVENWSRNGVAEGVFLDIWGKKENTNKKLSRWTNKRKTDNLGIANKKRRRFE